MIGHITRNLFTSDVLFKFRQSCTDFQVTRIAIDFTVTKMSHIQIETFVK